MMPATLATAGAGWSSCRPAAACRRNHVLTPIPCRARRVRPLPPRNQGDKEAAAARGAAAGTPDTNFGKLASEAAGLLASELGDPQTLDKLAKW